MMRRFTASSADTKMLRDVEPAPRQQPRELLLHDLLAATLARAARSARCGRCG